MIWQACYSDPVWHGDEHAFFSGGERLSIAGLASNSDAVSICNSLVQASQVVVGVGYLVVIYPTATKYEISKLTCCALSPTQNNKLSVSVCSGLEVGVHQALSKVEPI